MKQVEVHCDFIETWHFFKDDKENYYMVFVTKDKKEIQMQIHKNHFENFMDQKNKFFAVARAKERNKE